MPVTSNIERLFNVEITPWEEKLKYAGIDKFTKVVSPC